MPVLRNVLAIFADLAYPTTCVHCQTFCDGAGPLCPPCDAQLSELTLAPACIHCAMPLAYTDAPCPRCLGKGLHPFRHISRLCVYSNPIKSIIHQFKYHRRWPLADWLADRLLDQPATLAILKN